VISRVSPPDHTDQFGCIIGFSQVESTHHINAFCSSWRTMVGPLHWFNVSQMQHISTFWR